MIDELLGRLEASTVKFDIGRGGIPQLTPQDVAAALGMCEDRFAATIFHAAAGGTISDWDGIDRMIAEVQFGEWRNRADRLVNAQLAKAAALIAPVDVRADMDARAEMMIAGARAAMWPSLIEETYGAMRKALIAELRSSRACGPCGGRGWVQIETAMKECERCLGTGLTFVSDRQRAQMLGIDHSTYRRGGWKAAYEWMYRRLIDSAAVGRAQFSAAMERFTA
jgi:hypothetical protein